MKLEANITRFAPRDGYIMDAKKAKKAIEEVCEFWLISPGYYLCTTEEGNAYAISQYMDRIGCGCKDMTFNCTGKDICKHLIRFMHLKELPDKEIREDMAQLLRAAGWSGTPLTPPDRPEQRQRPKLPNIHDPDRKPVPQATQREKRKQSYDGKSADQIIEEMDDETLERNARKGGVMAKAELARRRSNES